MKSTKLNLKCVAVCAVPAIAIFCLVACGDPTAELLEGPATRVLSDEQTPSAYEGELCVNEARINVLVADTPQERAAGLSGYAGLPEDAGMLFVFSEPRQPSFWMKEMEFALDIIWIAEGRVVQIDASVPPAPKDTPDDQLPRYRPNEPVTHVLELTAGSAARLGITVGSRIESCPDATPTLHALNLTEKMHLRLKLGHSHEFCNSYSEMPSSKHSDGFPLL